MDSPRLLVQQLAALVARGEAPSPFSARDGTLLRLVPASERLSSSEVQEHLLVLWQQQPLMLDAATAAAAAAAAGRKASACRHVAAWARGAAYLQAGNSVQALRDARSAMAHATTAAEPVSLQPTSGDALGSGGSGTLVPTAAAAAAGANDVARPLQLAVTPGTNDSAGTAGGPCCTWFPALLLAGETFAALDEWPQAVLHLAKALQHAPPHAAAACRARLSAASRQLGPAHALAWAGGGAAGLLQQLRDDEEARLPEVLRPRPKWYYYNKWMTQRMHAALLTLQLAAADGGAANLAVCEPQQVLAAAEAFGADRPALLAAAAAAGLQVVPAAASAAEQSSPSYQLPQPLLDKLLAMDAGDLDLMVSHPSALQAQVYELLDVLESGGPEALQAHEVEPLSWREVQALAGPVVGLPLGYTAPPGAALVAAPAAKLLAAPAVPAAGNDRLESTASLVCIASPAGGWRQRGRSREQYLLGI